MPHWVFIYRLPIKANCSRYSGVHSALAPLSSSRAKPPVFWGTGAPRAARRMPLMRLVSSVAPVSSAPVEPAEISTSPSPLPSRLRPTVMLESFFCRKAVEYLSSMVMTSLACCTVILSAQRPARMGSISSCLPTRRILQPYFSAACTAPSTIHWGAWSPPMASMMILIRCPPPASLSVPPASPAPGGRWRYTAPAYCGCGCPDP